jgi:hypothetical protein
MVAANDMHIVAGTQSMDTKADGAWEATAGILKVTPAAKGCGSQSMFVWLRVIDESVAGARCERHSAPRVLAKHLLKTLRRLWGYLPLPQSRV